MNKLMLLAVAVGLTLGGCATQRPDDRRSGDWRYDNDRRWDRDDDDDDRWSRRDNDRWDRDERLERRLDYYADALRLTNRQQRQLRDIHERYERRGLTREERNSREAYRRLQQQKRREMLSVLTPAQRDRLYQLERERRDQRYGDRRPGDRRNNDRRN